MAAEYEKLYLETLLGNNREAVGNHVNGTVDYLHSTEHDYRWELLGKGLEKAAETVREGKPVLYYVVDDTSAGGRHAIEAVYTPSNDRVLIGVPEGANQKGHFPTILHTIEFLAETVQQANQGRDEKDKLSYPQLFFAPNDENRVSQVVTRNVPDIETVMVPLIVDPPYSNAVFIHTQARQIDPETTARAYYEVVKQDERLVNDLMRHTMLLKPKDTATQQPPSKQQAYVQVVPHEQLQEYKLVDLRRVQPWEQLQNPTHQQVDISITKDEAGRFTIPVAKQE